MYARQYIHVGDKKNLQNGEALSDTPNDSYYYYIKPAILQNNNFMEISFRIVNMYWTFTH